MKRTTGESCAPMSESTSMLRALTTDKMDVSRWQPAGIRSRTSRVTDAFTARNLGISLHQGCLTVRQMRITELIPHHSSEPNGNRQLCRI